MNKEEILAKAQAEKIDERDVFINDKSMRWTYLVMVLAAGIFMVIRSCRDMPITDLGATVCLSVAAGHIYRFIKTREKFYIIMGSIMVAIGMFLSIRFFIGH